MYQKHVPLSSCLSLFLFRVVVVGTPLFLCQYCQSRRRRRTRALSGSYGSLRFFDVMHLIRSFFSTMARKRKWSLVSLLLIDFPSVLNPFHWPRFIRHIKLHDNLVPLCILRKQISAGTYIVLWKNLLKSEPLPICTNSHASNCECPYNPLASFPHTGGSTECLESHPASQPWIALLHEQARRC